jgi:hypothetical protein
VKNSVKRTDGHDLSFKLADCLKNGGKLQVQREIKGKPDGFYRIEPSENMHNVELQCGHHAHMTMKYVRYHSSDFTFYFVQDRRQL